MESEADEDKAIQALDGAEWMERSLKVNKARQERKQKLLWWWSSKQPLLSKDSVKSKNQRFWELSRLVLHHFSRGVLLYKREIIQW